MAKLNISPKTLLMLGAAGAGVFLVYKLWGGVSAVAGAIGETVTETYTGARDAVATGLFSLFGPSDKEYGPDRYYTVRFPDGTHHAIGADRVSASGAFVWTGYPVGSEAPRNLKLVKDSQGYWYATA